MTETDSSKLPKMSEAMQTEVAQRAGLKHVETLEKNVLPTKQDLQEERNREDLKKGIEDFDKNSSLRHVEAEEKIVLPTTQDIISEKTPKMAAEFDKTGLKHVEPIVKTGVEGRENFEENFENFCF
uniref:Uncharacterized protein n=2 Tax=Meloidogyne TaxID=189290 RepID=A0A915MU23_MELJA